MHTSIFLCGITWLLAQSTENQISFNCLNILNPRFFKVGKGSLLRKNTVTIMCHLNIC